MAKKLNIVRFAPKGEASFADAVKAEVNEYFSSKNISPYANSAMWLKTVVMMSLYLVPYILMVSGVAGDRLWLFLLFWFLMGLGMIGIGTSVMHDANHGTYSANKKVNNFISHVLELLGGYRLTWRIQHNILHHTYTNITGLDEDIDSIKLLRFSPRQEFRPYHRYQFIYAWFFYTIMTLYWMTLKDYMQLMSYQKHDLLKKQGITLRQGIIRVSLYKLFYYSYIMILPIALGMPWYWVLGGFVLMHFTAGLVLSCIFQPSHIMETSGFMLPLEGEGDKRMEDSWAVHQLANTTNFAPESKIFSWCIGGLNYQIEHHLFPIVCHVHYQKLSPIVRSVAERFGLPYYIQPTFFKALLEHARMLKLLGKSKEPPVPRGSLGTNNLAPG
jgi:linoleoyl-CoA desaturase